MSELSHTSYARQAKHFASGYLEKYRPVLTDLLIRLWNPHPAAITGVASFGAGTLLYHYFHEHRNNERHIRSAVSHIIHVMSTRDDFEQLSQLNTVAIIQELENEVMAKIRRDELNIPEGKAVMRHLKRKVWETNIIDLNARRPAKRRRLVNGRPSAGGEDSSSSSSSDDDDDEDGAPGPLPGLPVQGPSSRGTAKPGPSRTVVIDDDEPAAEPEGKAKGSEEVTDDGMEEGEIIERVRGEELVDDGDDLISEPDDEPFDIDDAEIFGGPIEVEHAGDDNGEAYEGDSEEGLEDEEEEEEEDSDEEEEDDDAIRPTPGPTVETESESESESDSDSDSDSDSEPEPEPKRRSKKAKKEKKPEKRRHYKIRRDSRDPNGPGYGFNYDDWTSSTTSGSSGSSSSWSEGPSPTAPRTINTSTTGDENQYQDRGMESLVYTSGTAGSTWTPPSGPSWASDPNHWSQQPQAQRIRSTLVPLVPSRATQPSNQPQQPSSSPIPSPPSRAAPSETPVQGTPVKSHRTGGSLAKARQYVQKGYVYPNSPRAVAPPGNRRFTGRPPPTASQDERTALSPITEDDPPSQEMTGTQYRVAESRRLHNQLRSSRPEQPWSTQRRTRAQTSQQPTSSPTPAAPSPAAPGEGMMERGIRDAFQAVGRTAPGESAGLRALRQRQQQQQQQDPLFQANLDDLAGMSVDDILELQDRNQITVDAAFRELTGRNASSMSSGSLPSSSGSSAANAPPWLRGRPRGRGSAARGRPRGSRNRSRSVEGSEGSRRSTRETRFQGGFGN